LSATDIVSDIGQKLHTDRERINITDPGEVEFWTKNSNAEGPTQAAVMRWAKVPMEVLLHLQK